MSDDAPIIVLGSGGHAKVLIDVLRANRAEILGLTDPQLTSGASGPLRVRCLGDDDTILQHAPRAIRLVNGIGALPGASSRRRERFEYYKRLGYHFATIVHPRAYVSPSVTLAEGVQVMAGVVVQADAEVGHNTILNTACSIDHDCRIGGHVHVAPGARLSGDVAVGDRAHVGTGAAIIQRIRIGEACVVGAGATVTKDLADHAWVVSAESRTRRRFSWDRASGNDG